MRNFTIIFAEKEGTSPLVRLMNNFEHISIVHQVNVGDWEPFDIHNRGAMTLENLECCLDMILNKDPINFFRLNQIYTETAKESLQEFSGDGVTGFKMRFTIPRKGSPFSSRLPENFSEDSFRQMMFKTLKKNDVVVLLAIRQDILRWALSRYHGDGTGNPGHLQFKLANGKIKREAIGKIHVDNARLEMIIAKCVEAHDRKYRLMKDLKLAGIDTHPVFYEDFLSDKQQYFSRLLDILELDISKDEIDTALKKGAYFEKVHSDDISEFVVNHEEIMEKFGSYLYLDNKSSN
jgi:hypothetical protein